MTLTKLAQTAGKVMALDLELRPRPHGSWFWTLFNAVSLLFSHHNFIFLLFPSHCFLRKHVRLFPDLTLSPVWTAVHHNRIARDLWKLNIPGTPRGTCRIRNLRNQSLERGILNQGFSDFKALLKLGSAYGKSTSPKQNLFICFSYILSQCDLKVENLIALKTQ